MSSNLFGVPQVTIPPAGAIEYARCTTLNQNTLNNPLWADVSLNAPSLDTNIAGLVIASDEIQNVPQGRYFMAGFFRFQSLVQDAGLRGTFRINGGVATVWAESTGNVSAQGGWILQSVPFSAIIDCPLLTNGVGMSARRNGPAGALTTTNGSLSIMRIT